MEHLKNFKHSVPVSLQHKMQALAQLMLDEWRDIIRTGECVISPETVQEIEGNYRSGWNPKQDGGFEVSGFYMNHTDSSHHFTVNQTTWNENQQNDCFHAFCLDNKIDADDWHSLTEEEQDKYANYENEWFEEALLQFQVFCEGYTDWKGGDKQVVIRLSVNYKDAPYYREGDAEDIHSEILEVDEFMSMDNQEILEKFRV